jgi:hypothetical protein
MPLILAVDADKRHSAQLAALLRTHVDADLVQCASAAEGLAILQGRVPDLILTSQLLSPRDETALDQHLRELGEIASYVQTLTIPVLASSKRSARKAKKSGGMLSALRMEKADEDDDAGGCDPKVFAAEVRLYLDRALERRTFKSGDAVMATTPAVAVPVAVSEPVDPETAVAVTAMQLDDCAIDGASIESMSFEPVTFEPAHSEQVVRDADPFDTVSLSFDTNASDDESFESGPLEPISLDTAAQDTGDVVLRDAIPEAPEAGTVRRLSVNDPFESLLAPPPMPTHIVDAVRVRGPEPKVPTVDINEYVALDALAAQFCDASPEEEPVASVAPEAPAWRAPVETVAVHFEEPPAEALIDEPAPSWPWLEVPVTSLADVLSGATAAPAAHPARATVHVSDVPVAPPVVELPMVVVPEPVAVAPEPVVVTPPEPPPLVLDPAMLESIGAFAHQAGLEALGALTAPVRSTMGSLDYAALEDEAVSSPPAESSRSSSVAPSVVSRPSGAERRDGKAKKAAVAASGAQNEWGLFDPAQAGAAALFDEEDWEEEAAPKAPRHRTATY